MAFVQFKKFQLRLLLAAEPMDYANSWTCYKALMFVCWQCDIANLSEIELKTNLKQL